MEETIIAISSLEINIFYLCYCLLVYHTLTTRHDQEFVLLVFIFSVWLQADIKIRYAEVVDVSKIVFNPESKGREGKEPLVFLLLVLSIRVHRLLYSHSVLMDCLLG